ncbi:hypothetical protein VD0002_g5841 [Verticillium dahliae]|nr:hypothetical protein VD0004_g7719 [Verticillium dahliae]PNH49860.1 hypothetical protein VD0003_g7293 [Verticillium dahliae]PNH62141.1 hypothetical protein VD0002_g5841 [Verticillium dahliae]PNH68138.1 hypothetical protein VD0001_g7603 [Verticillium dahliae]RBQ93222.1 hypothetical protein VDGD_20367 [Verticillium dahliae]
MRHYEDVEVAKQLDMDSSLEGDDIYLDSQPLTIAIEGPPSFTLKTRDP